MSEISSAIPAMLWAMTYVAACLINLYAGMMTTNRGIGMLIRLATIFAISFLSMTFHLTLN